jgi:hypothetical protein
MVKVFLDIAGLYYSTEVNVPEGATVKDVLDAARGKPNHLGAILDYAQEENAASVDARFTVDSITIYHNENSAVSRQDSVNPRKYPRGVYQFKDDGTFASGLLASTDPNKNFVHAWQYYVYDKNFVDQSRKNGGGYGSVERMIVGYSVKTNKGYELTEGSTVVWRLVTILVGPTAQPHVSSGIVSGAPGGLAND